MAPFVLFIFTIILLPVERSAGQSECSVCEIDGASCSGTKINCSDKETCLTVRSQHNLTRQYSLSQGFARYCVGSKDNLTGLFHFNFGDNVVLDLASEACNLDCYPQIEDPPIRIYENGKYCPKCFTTGQNNCVEDGNVACRGDIVNCTEVNGVISHVYKGITTKISFAGKGCASASVNNIKKNQFIRLGTFTYTFNKVECSPANSALASLRRLAFTLDKKHLGPQMSFFLPCILGIFAVKILS
ncbi:phospholipase A2 inhibitor and Ly6/PLAUR domain-containing protein-like [Liasis olivaceus]